jgi:hypothetical protein
LEALKAQDPSKTYKWEYFIGKYGHFLSETATQREYRGGIDSIARFGHGGMNGWGATCGIPIAVAMVIQQAVPDAATPNLLDQLFANYGSAVHPQTDVTNAEWFYNGVKSGGLNGGANIQISRVALKQAKVGSMQCHNAIEQYIKLGGTYEPRKVRQEWCGRLTADQCYLAMKLINNYYHGTPFTATQLSPVVSTCAVSGCHLETGNPYGRTLGKEDCLVCHR